MKNLFLASLLFTIFSAISLRATSQKNKHSIAKKTVKGSALPVKFIEGIEIKRDIQPGTEPSANPGPAKNAEVTTISGIEKSLLVQFKYAQLLNRNVEAVTNLSLFNFIENWWQTRYSYGGNTKNGIDCSGFASRLLNDVYATIIPRTARDEYNASEKIVREKLMEGDLVFFNTRGGVSHVGVYLGDGYFVHASVVNGVTINSLDDDYYSARYLGGGRMLPAAGTK